MATLIHGLATDAAIVIGENPILQKLLFYTFSSALLEFVSAPSLLDLGEKTSLYREGPLKTPFVINRKFICGEGGVTLSRRLMVGLFSGGADRIRWTLCGHGDLGTS
jgi:hypothetical protein